MIMRPYDISCTKWNSLVDFLSIQWNVTPAMAEGQMNQMKFVCLNQDGEEVWITFSPEVEDNLIILRWTGGSGFVPAESRRKNPLWKMKMCPIP